MLPGPLRPWLAAAGCLLLLLLVPAGLTVGTRGLDLKEPTITKTLQDETTQQLWTELPTRSDPVDSSRLNASACQVPAESVLT
jgi:hypothetical protein